jgi:hypothetical protein
VWQAQQSIKHGKDAESKSMIQAIQAFGDKYVASEPRLLSSFAVGAGLKSFAFYAESMILTSPADKKQREQAEQQRDSWRKLAVDLSQEALKSLETEPRTSETSGCGLPSLDFAADEARVNALIEKMGLDKKG